ncbi:hypothetical protein L484_023252 [Morus notabilis]|uniref:BZIP domain-containing protein n=1 Tax=Morus notabilis TaxID=981085 RepID=W9RWA3_9ROSA|nr:hypothetical protein L484_023252 [Morus notabilis]
MENGQSVSSCQMQGNLSVELVGQREHSITHNDIMTRRMKNRERQRRYRARKRLEADLQKSNIIEQPTSQVKEVQPNSVVSKHCRRDWKKDARRAHVLKNPDASPNGSAIIIPVLSSESQTLGLSSGTEAEFPVQRESHPETSLDIVNHLMHRTATGRRDWKAEARKKKT